MEFKRNEDPLKLAQNERVLSPAANYQMADIYFLTCPDMSKREEEKV